MTSSRSSRPLRVLAWPAFVNRVENPYNWLLYQHVRARGHDVVEFTRANATAGRFDVLHIHWPEIAWERLSGPSAALKAAAIIALFSLMKLKGTRIVWTVHNLRSHDQKHPLLERAYYWALHMLCDGMIALSDVGRRLANERYPRLARRASVTIPLGHFRGHYPDDISRTEARRRLRIPPNVFLLGSFGRIRQYKNLPALVSAFRALGPGDTQLLIAGDVADDVELSSLQGPGVRVVPVHLADEELQHYYRAADLIVLPYRDILNSASAMLALSFGRPVLIPGVQTMQELQSSVGQHWIRLYQPPLDAAALQAAIDWCGKREDSERAPLESFGWAEIAGSTIEFYRTLLR